MATKKAQFNFRQEIFNDRVSILKRCDEMIQDHLDRGLDIPFVILLTVSFDEHKKNLQDKIRIDLIKFRVDGGHNQPESIQNMMRHKKLPIAYWFPKMEDIEKAKEAIAKDDSEYLITGDIALALNVKGDPYAKLREFCDGEINKLLNNWKVTDKIVGQDKQIEDLQRKVAELKGKKEKDVKPNDEDPKVEKKTDLATDKTKAEAEAKKAELRNQLGG